MITDTVPQDALAGFLLSNPRMASFELLNALREHPVGDTFPQYQMLEKSGGLNGSSPAEVVAMFLKSDGKDGVQIVANCLNSWNDCVATDPALAQPWRQMLWLTEHVRGQDQEPPALADVAADMATLSEHEYDRQRKGAAKALGIRVTVLDRAVERTRKGESPDEPARPAPLPETGAIPLKFSEKGKPLAIVFNVIQVLELNEAWRGAIAFDEFAMRPVFRRKPPFVGENGAWSGEREVIDADDVEIAAWMQQRFDLHVTPKTCSDALNAVSARHPFHPVKDYLESLTWDGTPRISDWLADYFGVERSPYSLAVAAKTLIGAVARIYSPGCKMDTMTILESPQQGLKKSSAWRVLASDEWFSDTVLDVHSKDMMQGLHGKWLIEMGDLSALNRSDVEAIKRSLSSQDDHYRPSYQQRARTFKRQSIFVGSSNRKDYLKDVTGNRRFWPIACEHAADVDALQAARNQLWAEAVHRYKSGDRWYLEDHLIDEAESEQEQRMEGDEWEEPISAWLGTQQEKVTSADILARALGLEDKRDWTQLASRRVAAVMQTLGWVRQSVWIEGIAVRGYRKLRSGEKYRNLNPRLSSTPPAPGGRLR